MYRKRLRPAYTPMELRQLYKAPHVHTKWVDHRFRVSTTIGIGRVLCPAGMVVDLSCGDATIVRGIVAGNPTMYQTYLGDFAYHPDYNAQGPIEETLIHAPHANLFVLSETIEHLDNPDYVLKLLRQKSTQLLLSTPKGEDNNRNPEHYWGWDDVAMGVMLMEAGWDPVVYTEQTMPGYEYTYQIWGCK